MLLSDVYDNFNDDDFNVIFAKRNMSIFTYEEEGEKREEMYVLRA